MSGPDSPAPIVASTTPWHLSDVALTEIATSLQQAGLSSDTLRGGDRMPGADRDGDDPAGQAGSDTTMLLADSPSRMNAAFAQAVRQAHEHATTATVDWPLAHWTEPHLVATTPSGYRLYSQYELPDDREAVIWRQPHQLVLAGNDFRGFLVGFLQTNVDIGNLGITIDADLAEFVTLHYVHGPLHAGQQRGVDIEIHPELVGAGTATGLLTAVDATTFAQLGSCRLTVGIGRLETCTTETADEHGTAIQRSAHRMANRLSAGSVSPTRAAAAMHRTRLRTWAIDAMTLKGIRRSLRQ